jgi:endonuclease YncB( thermonuclease family)
LSVSGLLLGLVVALGLAVSSPVTAREVVGRASVIDGDTIEIRSERIRLEGIDAFESSQLCILDGTPWRCGQAAALALSDLLGQQTVHCLESGKDRYKRTLAKCFVGQLDVNGWLVAGGWALAYRRYSVEYVPQEDTARESRVGAWAGSFDAPWDWRKGRRRQ